MMICSRWDGFGELKIPTTIGCCQLNVSLPCRLGDQALMLAPSLKMNFKHRFALILYEWQAYLFERCFS